MFFNIVKVAVFKLLTTLLCKNPLREFRENYEKNEKIKRERGFSEKENPKQWFLHIVGKRFY